MSLFVFTGSVQAGGALSNLDVKLYKGEQIYRMYIDGNEDLMAFCVRPNKAARPAANIANNSPTTVNESTQFKYLKLLTDEQKWAIGRLMYYGYPNASNSDAYYTATQVLMWEAIVGVRSINYDSDTQKANYFAVNSGKFATRNYWVFPSAAISNQTNFRKAYDTIVSKMRNYFTISGAMQSSNDATTSKNNAKLMTFSFADNAYIRKFDIGSAFMTDVLKNFNDSNKGIKARIDQLAKGWDGTTNVSIDKTSVANAWRFTIKNTGARPFASGNIQVTQLIEQVLRSNRGQVPTQAFYAWQAGSSEPDYQTLIQKWRADPVHGYLSFDVPNYPNLVIQKQFKTADGTILSGSTAATYLKEVGFKIKTPHEGSWRYVVAKKDSSNVYIFSTTTSNANNATVFKFTDGATGSNGIFNAHAQLVVCDLPANGTARNYYVEETLGANSKAVTEGGFSSKTVTKKAVLPAYSTSNPNLNRNVTTKFINVSKDTPAEVELEKLLLDKNGNNIDFEDVASAKTASANFASAKFVAFYVQDGKIKYINPVLKDPKGKSESGNDKNGIYYVSTTTSGGKKVINPSSVTEDISSATKLSVGYSDNSGNTGTAITSVDALCEYFGKIHLFDVPDGVAIGFMEVNSVKGYGYPEEAGKVISEESLVKSSGDTAGVVKINNQDMPFAYGSPASSGSIDSMEIENQQYYLNVTVKKVDNFQNTLEGVKIGLYTKSDDSYNLVETATTDANGIAKFNTRVTPGAKCYYHEVEALEGYKADTGYYEFDTNKSNNDKPISANLSTADPKTLVNTAYTSRIEIIKLDADTEDAISNVEFDIETDQDLSIDEVKNIKIDNASDKNIRIDAKEYKAGDVIATLKTDANGIIAMSGLPIGTKTDSEYSYTYTAVEKSVVEPYVIDEENNEVKFSFTDSDYDSDISKSLNTPTLSKSETVHNSPELVKLEITKTDENNNTIADVSFDVYTKEDVVINGKVINKAEEKLGTITTDSKGVAKNYRAVKNTGENSDSEYSVEYLFKLYAGFKYYYVETKAPAKYVVDATPSEFSFEFDNKFEGLVEETKINKVATGSITLTKFDKDYPENKLSGAEFTVYNSEGEVIGTMTEEDGVYTFPGLSYGTYTVKETKAPEGFLLDKNTYTVDITEDGKVYEVENEAGVGFANSPIKGSITLTKFDKEYPENKLSGAEFTVYDADKKVVGTMSEKDGVYTISGLRYGTYTVKETKAPEGFVADLNVYTVKIEENDKVYTVENEAGVGFANSPIKGNIELVKVDADDKEKKLSGAEFTVYKDVDGDGKYTKDVDTVAGKLTEKKGTYSIADLRYGKYLVKETKAPQNYKLDGNYYAVEITENGKSYTVSNDESGKFINKPMTGKVIITKTDVVDSSTLPNCGIRIYDSKGNVIFEKYTDANGQIVIDNLRIGDYYFQEFDAPDGYLINDEKVKFSIKKDGEVIKAHLVDERVPGHIPKTGVDVDVAVMIAIAAVGLIGLIILIPLEMKKRKGK